uniref:NADH dehydrogenase [ubiquinone] 1 alpha subcomplex subunit 2 n=1 Tax=Anopheles atroparvus TaxID=41427 RepID=A0A182IXG9_ANOAO
MRLSLLRFARLNPSVKELRLHLCQTGEESKGVRDFVNTRYVQLKRDNPSLPILVRECSGVQPRLWARYELGKEKSVTLTNATAEDISKHIETLSKAQ